MNPPALPSLLYIICSLVQALNLNSFSNHQRSFLSSGERGARNVGGVSAQASDGVGGQAALMGGA